MFKVLREFTGESPSRESPSHWSSASGNIKYLTIHLTLQNHLIEEPSNFISGSSSWHITTLPSFLAITFVVVEICL